jgi:hypothetical protein
VCHHQECVAFLNVCLCKLKGHTLPECTLRFLSAHTLLKYMLLECVYRLRIYLFEGYTLAESSYFGDASGAGGFGIGDEEQEVEG